MQGIFVGGARPKSKKQVKEAVAEDASRVRLQGTSAFGDDFDGPVNMAPDGTYNFVGPDPYTDRRFYGNIIVKGDKITVK